MDEWIVVLANTALIDGEPVWDDGHIWQVYVEEPDGQRTYLFSRWVQLGLLEAMIGAKRQDGVAEIVLLEKGAGMLNVYATMYRAPEDTSSVQLLNVPIDWFVAQAPAGEQ